MGKNETLSQNSWTRCKQQTIIKKHLHQLYYTNEWDKIPIVKFVLHNLWYQRIDTVPFLSQSALHGRNQAYRSLIYAASFYLVSHYLSCSEVEWFPILAGMNYTFDQSCDLPPCPRSGKSMQIYLQHYLRWWLGALCLILRWITLCYSKPHLQDVVDIYLRAKWTEQKEMRLPSSFSQILRPLCHFWAFACVCNVLCVCHINQSSHHLHQQHPFFSQDVFFIAWPCILKSFCNDP